jgi:hypothetical protein
MRPHVASLRLTAGLACLATTACLLPEDPVLDHLWEGRIVANSGVPSQIEGLAQLVGQGDVTRVFVGVLYLGGAELPVQLAWRIREGRCAASGDPVVNPTSLPPIPLTGPRGHGELEFTFGRRLSVHLPYAAEIFSASEPSGSPIACGNLIRMQ